MHAFLTFLFASFRDWLNTVRDYIDDWLGGGGGTPTTPPGETINVTDQDGLFSGGDNGDTITATHTTGSAAFYLYGDYREPLGDFFDEDGHWYAIGEDWIIWNPSTSISSDGAIAGLLMLRGNGGNDRFSITGTAINADAGSGNDTITAHGTGTAVGNIRRMLVRGAEGDDSITATGSGVVVQAGAGNDFLSISGTQLNAHGGTGNDRFILSGSQMEINGGGGADRIDVTNLTNSHIMLDRDDTLIGRGNGDDGLRFHLAQGRDFTGNAANDYLITYGGRIDGAEGNDTLRVIEYNVTSSTLIGGNGDDVIYGGNLFEPEGTNPSDWYVFHVGHTSDLLLGGAGNDRIEFDQSDTVTGGAGADTFVGFVGDPLMPLVTDFVAGEDEMILHLGPSDSDFRHVVVDEQDGDMLISHAGDSMVRIEGGADLVVGFQIDTSNGSTLYYTDLDGNVVDRAALDVIVDIYESRIIWTHPVE